MQNHEDRKQLLLKMYDQMFADVNRHIVVVWQSVATLVGAFAIFALVEKQILNFDVACTLIILIAGWLLAHLHDAAYWYNRNLVIIANIEREFLREADLRLIHYYFGKHRPGNKMITHLRIQYALGLGVAAVVLLYHILTRVAPGFGQEGSSVDWIRTLPYVMATVVGLYLYWLYRKRKSDYDEFLRNSPGKTINATGISYGPGHGFPRGQGSDTSGPGNNVSAGQPPPSGQDLQTG